MLATVNEIQSRVAAVVDQNEDTSAISSDDYSLRLKYMNMAQAEWAEIYDWDVLYKEYNMKISTSSGNASVVLPNDFRRPATFPKIMTDTEALDYAITRPQERSLYLDTDRHVEFLGNYFSGYVMRIYGTTLASGASVKVPYFSSPQSLASPIDVSPIPNPEFLVKRTIAYVWETREDPRFPTMKAEADTILRNLIERESVATEGSTFGRAKTVEESYWNFRWGRD